MTSCPSNSHWWPGREMLRARRTNSLCLCHGCLLHNIWKDLSFLQKLTTCVSDLRHTFKSICHQENVNKKELAQGYEIFFLVGTTYFHSIKTSPKHDSKWTKPKWTSCEGLNLERMHLAGWLLLCRRLCSAAVNIIGVCCGSAAALFISQKRLQSLQ